jgi:hypothetical protein
MLSHRYAIYASPTAELALENSSAPLADGVPYVAYQVIVGADEIRVAQLQVSDARNYANICMISRWFSRHSREFNETPLADRQGLALLFISGPRQNEQVDLRRQRFLIQQLCTHVQDHFTH